MLAMLSVLLLPRQFQMMVVECVDERHLRRAAWVFPGYLLLINVFVLPIAIGGQVLFGPGRMDAETFVLSLPLATARRRWRSFAYRRRPVRGHRDADRRDRRDRHHGLQRPGDAGAAAPARRSAAAPAAT